MASQTCLRLGRAGTIFPVIHKMGREKGAYVARSRKASLSAHTTPALRRSGPLRPETSSCAQSLLQAGDRDTALRQACRRVGPELIFMRHPPGLIFTR